MRVEFSPADGLSPILWLYIRRLWTWVRPRARFVNLGWKIGRLLNQGRRKLGVVCGLRELKSRRCLTQVIPSTDHFTFPVVCHQRRCHYAGIGHLFQTESTKVNLGAVVFHGWHTLPGSRNVLFSKQATAKINLGH